MSESQSRAKRLFDRIDADAEIKQKPKVLILANGVEPHLDSSFFYVLGFSYGLFEGSILVMERGGKLSLITSTLEEPIARAFVGKDLEIFVEMEPEKIRARLQKIIRSANVIGLNSAELSYKMFLELKSIFKQSKFMDVSDAFEALRLIKDATEIEKIQMACDIASNIYRKIPSMLDTGVSESSVAANMAFEMEKLGGTGVSFDTIVGFGKNSAQPHYSAGSAELKKNQFVLCDYGTKYRKYCSDITRTLVFGRASEKQKRMYEVVKSAQELGTELCTTENTGAEVHEKVAKLINATEFKGRFIHSTGHSLGLNVHDGPGLTLRNKKKLEPGMVLTVEPGVYLPGLGGVRIEDDVLITKGKPRILTSATRELIEV